MTRVKADVYNPLDKSNLGKSVADALLMRQLGNAVPVDLAEVVARSVCPQLEGAKSRTGRA